MEMKNFFKNEIIDADPICRVKNRLYQLIISNVTELCYCNCLEYFSDHSNILDVGIGNGMMIRKFHGLIKSKQLRIVGIDINKHYLNHCDGLIKGYGLENHIETYCKSIEDFEPKIKNYFDFVLFSMSFMLFDDQRLVLHRIKEWIRPGGKIVFFQTMYKDRFRLMDFIKPKLVYFTSIDFGKVTYENDFFSLLDKNNIYVSEDRMIKKEWFKGEYRMIVAALGNES